ncbi:hypothetical protein C2845_PM03G27250 [Panicum miliaceum]|uniref:Myb/SANT-like domain-containing protein n=1 Tax=Panicum miliaceum TaxID=4540 RepID=A0A3L6T3M1_PANMI|nr:hypothetical protein C2845_PM03G27250 [Panicum miliaceum]
MADTSRNVLNLFDDSQAGEEEDEFFGDGSQATPFPGLGEYQRMLQSDEAPARRRSGKHVVTAQARGRSAGRGAGGRRSASSVDVPPRPARSGAARGGGGVVRTRSQANAVRAQSASRINVDDDEDCYGSMSMGAGGSNMRLNSDEEEDDDDENICKDFRRICGKNYNVKAMKNRYTQAKVLATWWKEVRLKSSGLGQGPNGEILSSETWWINNTKGKSECYKVFKDRMPPYFDDLVMIFEHVTVDGSSAYCPGFEQADKGSGVARDLYDLTGEDDPYSPMSIGTKGPTNSGSKRPSNTATTGESPTKKTKSPMVKALRGLVAEIKIDREEGKKREDNYAKREEARSRAIVTAQAQIMEQKWLAIQAEMDECVALAKECGPWIAATMDQWAEEDEEEEEEEAAAAKRRKNLVFSAAELIGMYHLENMAIKEMSTNKLKRVDTIGLYGH